MEVPGVCSVCGAHDLVKSCVLCGQQVCRRHHDPASGACLPCAERRGAAPTGTPTGTARRPDPPEDAGGRKT